MKIAVVIVTCDAPERLKHHLRLLAGQSRRPDALIIVNNGSVPADYAQDFSKYFKIKILNRENDGPAGGFNAGARKAYSEGYDYVIFADDDCYPADPLTISYFAMHAQKKVPVVAGYYASGEKIMLANHYFMFHRSVFETAGFHFRPFFIYFEDKEFVERAARHFPILHDPCIIVNHKFFHFFRLPPKILYFQFRNQLIEHSLDGNILLFVRDFLFFLSASLFLSFQLRSMLFLKVFLLAVWDFMLGRTGNPRKDIPDHRLKKAEPDDLAGLPTLLPVESEGFLPFLSPLKLLAFPESDFSGLTIRKEKNPDLLSNLKTAVSLRGREVVVTNMFSTSYLLSLLFVKNVFLFDAQDSGEASLLYTNNPLFSVLWSFILFPLLLFFFLPVPPLTYLAKRSFYLNLHKKLVAQDIDFCREVKQPAI